jgi:RNA polymerase sigma-70 factor (ECF subfamily)
MPDAMSDDHLVSVYELVQRAKDGDRAAMSELVNRHEPMLLRWARRRLGYPLRTLEDTRDIIQDTYAVVLRKIGSFEYEDSRSFARWMRGIVTRIVLAKSGGVHLKRRRALVEESRLPDVAATPSTSASLRELTHLRYGVLRELERLDRLIYRLRQRGFSSTQIADWVGMSDRAVRMRFARAEARIRLRMKQILEGRGRVPRS